MFHTNKTQPLVISLNKLVMEDRSLAGGKAVNLGVMLGAGMKVPRGFCVTTTAFHLWLNRDDAALSAVKRLDEMKGFPAKAILRESAFLRNKLERLPIPPAVEHTLMAARDRHNLSGDLAVRSSATTEDLPNASFAGQHDTILNIRDSYALSEAVHQCWISLYTDRAVAYRLSQGIPHRNAAMAVIVQEMVAATASGVLFTIDPLTGNSGRIIIEGVHGLGEALVSGKVSPERWILEKISLRVMDPVTCPEESAFLPDQSGEMRQRPRGEDLREGPCLNKQLAQELGLLARKVERLFGRPQDIEWSVSGPDIYLLQARPVTAIPLAQSWEDRQVWCNLNTGEVFPDVTTPITWSVLQHLMTSLFKTLFQFFGADVTQRQAVGLVAGRAYFNVNTGFAALKPFSFLLPHLYSVARSIGGGRTDLYQPEFFEVPDEDLPDLGFSWGKFLLSWPRLFYELITHSPRRGDAWSTQLAARYTQLTSRDIGPMSVPELAQCFTQSLHDGFQGWDLLYLVTQGAALPIFQKACQHWLNDPDLALGYRLFAALGNVPETEAGLALWRLAALAHSDPWTESLLLSDSGWVSLCPRLGQTEQGRQVLNAWTQFMSQHGHHCRGELELFNARWSESPDYILGLVRGYIRAIGQSNPLENQSRLAQARLQLTEQCCQRLKNPLKRWIFIKSLIRAQKLAVHREEWKNQAVRHIAWLRRILLLLGQRLNQAGILAQPADVFFLEVAEIESIARSSIPSDLRGIIDQRRAAYNKNLDLNPPHVIVGQFEPTTGANPINLKQGEVLQGIPVFPGTVTGLARVILRANNHEQVLPGEILVAPFTDPAWTPYFLMAAGVVIDRGGILSHGSIVAREYGLPSVTNVIHATSTIRTGDRLRVDGARGQVIILNQKSI